jgi:hypothetical protein
MDDEITGEINQGKIKAPWHLQEKVKALQEKAQR